MHSAGIVGSGDGTGGSRPLRPIAVTAGTAAVVTAANASQGAYFSQSWGWVALAFLIPTTLALILDRAILPGRFRIAFTLLVLALAGWSALSAVWSSSTPGSIREFERILVYASVALAIAFLLGSRDGPPVLAGVLVGTSLVSVYSLATRLIPDHFVTHDDPSLENRLGQPLGYPNALAALAALGILIAFAFVSHGRLSSAIPAAVALPVLSATLYFTFSRAAWAALVLSYGAALILDPRWLRSLVASSFTALPAITFLLIASQQEALTSARLNVRSSAVEGHRLAFALVLLSACSALFAWVARAAVRRMTASPRGSRMVGVAVICAAVVGASVVVVAHGGPARAVAELKDSFNTLPAGGTTGPEDLNTRLFKIYGTGRAQIWPVAWNEFRESPVLGQGAGAFEYSWYEQRPSTRIVRDAHSVYLEALAEVGLVGFGLLFAALLLPLIAGFCTRRSRFVPYGTAAYLGWAGACAVDWHWEMTGLTITALLSGSVGLLAADPAGGASPAGLRRAVPLAISIGLSVLAVVSLVGNQALFAARADLTHRDSEAARENSRLARELLPWSVEPKLALGDSEAQLGNRDGAVRAYRDAVRSDPRNWVAWLRLGQVARGVERRAAYAKVHALNPLEDDLPGERRSSG